MNNAKSPNRSLVLAANIMTLVGVAVYFDGSLEPSPGTGSPGRVRFETPDNLVPSPGRFSPEELSPLGVDDLKQRAGNMPFPFPEFQEPGVPLYVPPSPDPNRPGQPDYGRIEPLTGPWNPGQR